MATCTIGLSLGFLPMVSQAQPSDVLNRYIAEAYSKSPLLKEAVLKLESQRITQDLSTRMNKPELGFGTTYSLADGGRRIEFPVGDLLNPVYATLNRLTQSSSFPGIENVEEQFLPNNFYDARFRIRQPILRAEIALNRSLQGLQTDIQALRVQVVQREIAKEVKVAYFNYLQTDALIGVLEKYRTLIDAQRRVQEGLLRNDKIIASALDRNTAERAKLETQLLSARLNRDNARLYFNFLLQRASDEPIQIDSQLVFAEPLVPVGPEMREEIAQLKIAKEAGTLLVNLEEARRRPVIGAQLDIGSQGFDFKWGGYVLLGLSLEVPIWNWGRQKLQVQKAQVESMQLDERLRYSERALQ
ncbi:MAG: TolC family protein, partial [Haliscomenobacter sp.]